MTDDFRTRLERELAALDAPPLGDLARHSLAEGRRLRAVRRRYQAGIAAAAGLVLIATVVGIPMLWGSSTASGPVVVPQPAASRSTPSVAPSVKPSPDEARVEATPEGLLAAFLEVLPDGKTSHYAGGGTAASTGGANPLSVRAYLDTGRGPGMLRLEVWTDDSPVEGGQATSPALGDGLPAMTSWTQDDGDVVTVSRTPDNCIQSLMVWVQRRDGIVVGLTVSSCLAFDGQHNPAGRLALTEKQAVKVADDDRLGLRLSRRLVKEGATRFPDLPTVG